MRRLIMDKISLFLTNDGELDDRARGERQQHRAVDKLAVADRRRGDSRRSPGSMKWAIAASVLPRT